MRKKLLWTIFIIPLAIALIPNIAMAPTSAPVYVDPEVIMDEYLIPGTTFSVDIVVEYVENLWAYQFWLGFNPEVLNGVSVEDGPFLGTHLPAGPGGIWHVEVAEGPGFDNEVGELKLFGASVYFETFPPPPMFLADGGGVLATVTFEVVGYGESEIILGAETALLGTTYPPPFPAEAYYIFYGAGEPGYFSNVPGRPELEMPHGVSGVWEEYQTILVGDPQTTYCMIRNWGEDGADVQAIFIVSGPGGVVNIPSNIATIGPRNPDGTPSEVTVSATYIPGIDGKYKVCAMLLFKCGWMTDLSPYYLLEPEVGGESTTRPINVAYKVVTHM